MNDIINGIINILTSATVTTLIAAVISTTLTHIWNQFRENKIKSYEIRKPEYIKLAELTADLIKVATRGDTNEIKNILDQFDKLGLKLAIVGSKEFFESFLFLRWIGRNSDELKTKGLYSTSMVTFAVGEMLQAMRKEIALTKGKVDVLDIMESALFNVRAPEILKEFELYNKNKPELKKLYLKHKNPCPQLKEKNNG